MCKPVSTLQLGLLFTAVLPWTVTSGMAAQSGPQLGGFWLLDTDTGLEYEELAFDDLIDLDHSPEHLSIIVDPIEPVGSVVFTLDGVPVYNRRPSEFKGVCDSGARERF